MTIEKICEVCSKTYSVINSRATKARTCSQKCRGILIAKSYQDARTDMQCGWCKKAFQVPPSRALRGNGKFCSTNCHAEAMRTQVHKTWVEDGDMVSLRNGYQMVQARFHPYSYRGRVLQHRLVIESLMREQATDHPFLIEIDGVKYLRSEIDVHHRNEDKVDNAPSNLVACTKAAHADFHAGKITPRGETWPPEAQSVEPVARKVNCICEKCSKPFVRKLSEVSPGASTFCSRKCFGTSTMVSCQCCGTPFKVKQSDLDAGRGKFCSMQCYRKS